MRAEKVVAIDRGRCMLAIEAGVKQIVPGFKESSDKERCQHQRRSGPVNLRYRRRQLSSGRSRYTQRLEDYRSLLANQASIGTSCTENLILYLVTVRWLVG